MNTLPKIGARVRINEMCVEPYIGKTGIVKSINPNLEDDPLGIEVEFDQPIFSLKGEYFAKRELDLI